ncbi:MAG TPA: MSMEG_1061 family FMN-dependent PPOX-type flavoprotein [Trebonia sp.]|nr:MSMEG_1061 family FMN-dependent PPOX-type flavoprotein [Trebonia sp.]
MSTSPATEITEITTEAELREALGGHATGRAATKDRSALHPLQIEWLEMSPFCVLATSDANGNCDASPKGDPAGHLIHVLDPRTIVIAERPGNKRADGYLNILSNPHVGVIALIPGRSDTLRVNGRARLVRDAPWFSELEVRGKRPVLAVVIEVEQVFSHCPKAFLRSGLWEPERWPAIGEMPSVAALCKVVQNPPETLEELEAYYATPNYSGGLY